MPEPKKNKLRNGPVTGARIVLALMSGAVRHPSAGGIANVLGCSQSYARRVCLMLVSEGLLIAREQKQRGTHPVVMFRVVEPEAILSPRRRVVAQDVADTTSRD